MCRVLSVHLKLQVAKKKKTKQQYDHKHYEK